MRGKKAKLLRKIAYSQKIGDAIFVLDYNDREYEYVDSPNRHRSLNKTCIADEQRYLYQSLKGRRGVSGI